MPEQRTPTRPATGEAGAAEPSRASTKGGSAPGPDEDIDLARRKLITHGAYVAPAIVAMVAASAAGLRPQPSCTPNVPCDPPGDPDPPPCNPQA